ncbi:MAG: hypothetical protein ACYCWE_12670 [Eubacteriales bacterium]
MKSNEDYKILNNNNIGIFKERTLHAALKSYYEPDRTRQEQPLLGYIADIYNEEGVTEIQTQGFYSMKKKLEIFLPEFPVTIVYPAVRQKWLIWINPETGEVTSKRRSPKFGTPYIVFDELYSIRTLLTHKNLRLKIVMVDVEEYRQLNGWSRDKKRGSTRNERIPVGMGDEITINNKYDYIKLIPDNLPSSFYTADYAKNAEISRSSAQTALNVLNSVDAVERIGRDKKGYIYKIK